MHQCNCDEMYIVDQADLIEFCSIQLKEPADVINSVNLLYDIKKKNIYVVNVISTDSNLCRDYYFDGKKGFWLFYNRIESNTKTEFISIYKKTNTLASKCLNCCDIQKDSLVLARAFMNQIVKQCTSFLDEECFPTVVYDNHSNNFAKIKFSSILEPIGFYQIVPNLSWLKYVINCGVKVIQLRIKDESMDKVIQEVEEGVYIANKYGIKLFINDYWELAIKYKAYGVHLGQEDLQNANFQEIFNAGLRLGISTHCYYELAIARYLSPSYIAFGPIFPTMLKNMNFMSQGVSLLASWVKHLHYRIVAIGGINLSNLDSIIKTGVDGIAVVSAVINSKYPDKAIREFLDKCS
ncbi:thiamine-phosphate pyrophosphorylase [Ehrlichia ruminantium]|uniref:thiamine phosphate synthase n=1 Tax=Ehrlichia ruminantium TaxID=779 RepID=UPI0007C11C72|nr:thiamine phosphate synthase [Ehrlichia ruminantium]QLK52133.1 thiamine phosphate synthase [Ehrlichia ruminantium]QLK53964.1 thiamine phosphate synthase [Ehrlichia ruminantium]GAT76021.1 thiamine-phosphate pyrophosphorylase [Ehrlichia ruminantium]